MKQQNRNLPSLWSGELWNAGNPTRGLTRLQRDIDRLFDQFLGPVMETGFMQPMTSFSPPVEIEERDDCYLLSFDLPGVKKNEVNIEMRGSQLVVTGDRKDERTEEEKGRQYTERFYGHFEKAFTLPQNVNSEQIEAKYEDGVLHIALPKAEQVKPKSIAIGERKGGILSRLVDKVSKESKKLEHEPQKKTA